MIPNNTSPLSTRVRILYVVSLIIFGLPPIYDNITFGSGDGNNSVLENRSVTP